MTLTQIKPAGLSKPVDLADNEQIRLGTGNDLKIYHDGSQSYIRDFSNQFNIRADNAIKFEPTNGSETYAKFVQNGAVELYYDHSKKFETTSAGVTVTGSLTTGDNVTLSGQNPRITFTDSNHNPDFELYGSAGNFKIWDSTNNVGRLVVTADGNIQLPSDNIPLQIGAGQDLEIYHDGSKSVIANKTGYLQINATETEVGIYVNPNAAVRLCYDNSLKFETTSSGIKVTGDASTGTIIQGAFSLRDTTSSSDRIKWIPNSPYVLRWSDNFKASFGSGDDLQIYHDGTDSHIQNTNNSGELKIRAHQTDIKNADNNETQAIFHENAAVELYYDNSKKLETTSVGATFSGNAFFPDNYGCQFGNAAGSADLLIYHDGSSNVLQTAVNTKIGKSGEASAWFNPDGAVQLYYDNVKKFETTSGGVNIPSGNLKIPDSGGTGYGRLVVGSGDDLQIYHNGSDSYVKNTTGDLYIRDTNGNIFIQPKTDENSISCVADGAVALYHDNVKKFETTNIGTTVTGKLGIGTTSPVSILHLHEAGATGTPIIQLSNGDTGSTSTDGFALGLNSEESPFIWNRENTDLRIATNNTERMRIENDGHIRFGPSGSGSDNAWNDAAYGNTEVAIDGGGGYGILHFRGDGSGSTNTRFSIGAGDDLFYLAYDDVDGRHNIVVSGDGVVSIPVGIELGSGTDGTAANTLDDYEEGTFTPSYPVGNATGKMFNSCNYNATGGKYTKIGNTVSFTLRIQAQNISYFRNTTHVQIEGLPFTAVSSQTGSQGGAVFSVASAVDDANDWKVPTLHISNNTSKIFFYSPKGHSYTVGGSSSNNDGDNNWNSALHIHGQYFTS